MPACGLPQKGIILGDKHQDDEKQHKSDQADYGLCLAGPLGLLVIPVPEAAGDICSRHIGFLLPASVDMPEFLLQGLFLRIIVSWPVVEHPVFLRAEKSKTEFHTLNL